MTTTDTDTASKILLRIPHPLLAKRSKERTKVTIESEMPYPGGPSFPYPTDIGSLPPARPPAQQDVSEQTRTFITRMTGIGRPIRRTSLC